MEQEKPVVIAEGIFEQIKHIPHYTQEGFNRAVQTAKVLENMICEELNSVGFDIEPISMEDM